MASSVDADRMKTAAQLSPVSVAVLSALAGPLASVRTSTQTELTIQYASVPENIFPDNKVAYLEEVSKKYKGKFWIAPAENLLQSKILVKES